MTPDQIIEVLEGFKAGRGWQFLSTANEWKTPTLSSLESMLHALYSQQTIRLAPLPDEITIPARVIPAPLREAPKVGTLVWSADPTLSTFSGAFTWNGGEWAVRQLERGFVYMEQKPSEQAGEAMCHYA